jgi:PKD repeat protein
VFGDGQTFHTKSFSRVFSSFGNVPLDLTINNGTASVTIHSVVQLPGDACLDVSANSASISFSQGATGCGPAGGGCTAGQDISFDVNAFAPSSFSCSTHSFTWSFSDGQTFTSKTLSRQFAAAGDYPVSLTIGGGSGSFTLHSSVHVISGGLCGTMSDGTVFLTYQGPSSQCTGLGGTCNPGEEIAFKVNDFHPAYNFACGTHTFTWDFGDGTGAHQSGQTNTHAYAAGGSFNVKVTVDNGSATFDAKTVVTVSNPVIAIEVFDFSVTPWYIDGVRVPNGYLFIPFSEPSPSAITWNWDFGDGNKAVTHDYKAVSHTFADSDDHTVTLTTPQGTGSHSHDLRTRRRPGR